MTGPAPDIVDFGIALHHAQRARGYRASAKELRAHGDVFCARAAEESARFHEGLVRAVAMLAMATATQVPA